LGRFAHLRALERALRETFAEHLAAHVNLRVLDLGCGGMPYRNLILPRAASYVGADLPANPRADIRIDNNGRTAMPDASCDLVLSTQVLEHTDNPAVHLNEAYRVLTPGGLLVLSTHGYWIFHPDPEDNWRWTAAGLTVILERSGFQVLSIRGVMGVAATSLQLLQDSLNPKLPVGVRHLFTAGCQGGIVLLDALQSQASKNRDACVFVVAARKPLPEKTLLTETNRQEVPLPLGSREHFRSMPSAQDSSGSRVHARVLHQPHVAILCPSRDQYSETFIRAHIQRLPGDVTVYYGACVPNQDGNGRELAGLTSRAARATLKVLGKRPSWVDERLLLRNMRHRGVQVALAEYGPTGVGIMRACRRYSVPLVVHFHGFDAYERVTLERYGTQYRELFGLAAATVVVSRDMEKQLINLGALPPKLHLIPYGVDTEMFSGADPAHSPPLFIAVGRFVDKKAPHLTLLAFAEVVKRCPDAKLMMIGDGPLKEGCVQLCKALRIEHAVEFPGIMQPLDVSLAMRRASAFVQHSVVTTSGDAEGTPVAAIEAAASGLPIVATAHRGLAEVVLDGETGFLIEEADIHSMSERMLALVLDRELAGRLGKQARDHALGHYSVQDRIADLGEVLIRAARASGA
jgi:colanic acid/amylovoran biosynthesis glycosyltransferase